jgi:methyltransferase
MINASPSLSQIILAAVLLERLFELWFARRNTERLLAEGATERGSEHYPYIVLLHAAWLGTLVLVTPEDAPVNFAWLGIYLLLQVARLWVIASLGRFWTTRIITARDAPLVRAGPYRFVRHPNYWVVAAEIAVLPLVFGEWQVAAVFTLLNALALRERIRVENDALAERKAVD